MKKLLSITLLVLTVLISAVIPIGAADTYKDGDVLYKQEFTSIGDVTSSPDYKVYGFAYDNGACTTLDCESGALHIVSSNKANDKTLGGRFGTRIRLYDVPDTVDRFSVTCDFYINEYLDQKNSYGPALLIADDGVSDTDIAAGVSKFSMIWMRIFNTGTTGAYTYGDTSLNVVSQKIDGFCTPATWYTVKVYVNTKDSSAIFNIINNTTKEEYYADYFFYNPCEVNKMLGIYNSGCDILVDNFTVFYGDALFGTAVADTTEAVTTPAPVVTTEAPVVTEAPATDAPATEAPATDAPATEAPATDAPATQAPVTDAPEKGGCGSSLGITFIILPVLGAAYIFGKKKSR